MQTNYKVTDATGSCCCVALPSPKPTSVVMGEATAFGYRMLQAQICGSRQRGKACRAFIYGFRV